MALTKRQREILDYIREFIAEQGYSPSLEEIGAHFGLSSVATVHRHVQHLLEKGVVRRVSNSSRSLEPVDDDGPVQLSQRLSQPLAQSAPDFGAEVLSLPLLVDVAAGQPIEALENPEPIYVPAEMAPSGKDLFVLRVRGSSMIDEQIRDGDYVIVESRAHAHQGETVVALVHGEEATLKKFYREGPVVRLVPANETMQPMEFPAEDVLVRGVVRGLLRSY
ncbi:MAG: transcriptional repressor LexA [Deltaproteobacteria bacterium]|nr:transcriptional repressor LexA [Deltaproteobacteria bacterium]